MQNLRLLQRQLNGKQLWENRDWVIFYESFYADVAQDSRISSISVRLQYERRLPTNSEIITIIRIIDGIYVTNNINSGYRERTFNGRILNLNTVLAEITSNSIFPQGSIASTPLGTVYTDNFTTPPSAFNASWGTAGTVVPTVSGGKANFASGSGIITWDRYARFLGYFLGTQKFTIKLNNVLNGSVRDATSYGIGFGLGSVIDNASAKTGFGCYLDFSTAVTGSKLRIGRFTAGSFTWTLMGESANDMPVLINQLFNLTLSRDVNVLTFTAENITVGTTKVLTFTYALDLPQANIMNNRGALYLHSLGTTGSVSVDSIEIISNDVINPHYTFHGDSISAGYSSITVAGRTIDLVAAATSRIIVNLSGAGTKVVDYYGGNSTEMQYYKPRKAYVMLGGTNNVEHDTLASYQTSVDAYVTAAIGFGGTVILGNLLPRNDGLDVRPFNAWLTERYGFGGTSGIRLKIMDRFANFRDSGMSTAFDGNPAYYDDTVHLNVAGNLRDANLIGPALLEFEAGNLN